MNLVRLLLSALILSLLPALLPAQEAGKPEPLPFNHKVETYRSADGKETVFCLRLEQAFLGEEFEKSNYLRLRPLDANAYLIYPPETRFHQKHAEFYGRLRGQGKARLRLTYEMVSENLDGSRKIVVRQGDVEAAIPTREGGPQAIYRDWAQQQNAYFANLLSYYPRDSFYQYVLLQSRARYGVTPPPLPGNAANDADIEAGFFNVFTGAHALQASLQQYSFRSGRGDGDQNIHISQLAPPDLPSLPYEALLAKKREQKLQPRPADIARLVPDDQYFLHFNSMDAASGALDLMAEWGDNLLRLFSPQARDHGLEEKLSTQLCLRRVGQARLFAEGAASELAVTGSDPFISQGSDVSILLKLRKPDALEQAAAEWLAQVKAGHPGVEEREFNYRSHKIRARYTIDRVVSSFVVRLGDYMVFSNSHRAIRKIVDTFTGFNPRLEAALDYRYLTTLLPPATEARSGYLFASEAYLRRLISPPFKISQKRRLQAFNTLVMINNASLFYRMENGTSPASLNDLVEGKYIDARYLVSPHGGAYSWDAQGDAATNSLYNRLRYLTPNVELTTLQVSAGEREEYERYKQHFGAFWRGTFTPMAIRLTMGQNVKLETCVPAQEGSTVYQDVRGLASGKPLPLRTAPIAPSAVMSLLLVSGRQANGGFLRQIPGVPEVLDADPTLTDLSWLGDRLSVHLCDDDAILEIDPALLRPLDQLGFKVGLREQVLAGLALTALKQPLYIGIEVEDRDKAARLLELLTGKIALQKSSFLGLPTALDAYRLPDYKNHAIYVLSFQLYALKIRLHVALVGDQLVAATRVRTLREVIDAATAKDARPPAEAQVLVRLNRKAMNRLTGDLQLYWEEKSRLACFDNIPPIQTLARLYGVPVSEVNKLAMAKYGVTYFCPDGGTYQYDPQREQVFSSVHGNRQNPRYNPPGGKSSFQRFLERFEEIDTTLRFDHDSLVTTVEILRPARQE